MINIQELFLVAPLIILTAGALLILLLEVFIKHDWSRSIVSMATIALALLMYLYCGDQFQLGKSLFSGHFAVDRLAYFFAILVLLIGLGAVILSSRNLRQLGIEARGEYHALLLFSMIGAIVFVSSMHFISLFIGLEIMSMALYALCASAPTESKSSEAALKYFLLGSFSSAFLLYGIAILYGLTGSMELNQVPLILAGVDSTMPMIAFSLVAIGLLFKVGVVPFHSWMPDVYQGAPTPVTAYMACAVKAAGFAVILRVIGGTFIEFSALWAGFVAFVAVATMVLGNCMALQQRSIKRMLAYSSIAHAGYLLVGVLALNNNQGGAAGILFYLISYSLMTFGCFAIVQIVSNSFSQQKNSDDIAHFQGLGKSSPLLAALLTLFLFALAGLPPGVAGFVGKFFLFSAAVRADYVMLSVVGVLASAVSCYYYLRVIVAMYFIDTSSVQVVVPNVSKTIQVTLILCALLVIMIGILPSRLYDISVAAVQGLF
jgi:NADH-quinone oxidoreductase subunit N